MSGGRGYLHYSVKTYQLFQVGLVSVEWFQLSMWTIYCILTGLKLVYLSCFGHINENKHNSSPQTVFCFNALIFLSCCTNCLTCSVGNLKLWAYVSFVAVLDPVFISSMKARYLITFNLRECSSDSKLTLNFKKPMEWTSQCMPVLDQCS